MRNIFIAILVSTTTISVCALNLKVNFTKTHTCPANSSLSQLTKLEGAVDSITCFVECAVAGNCSVLFRSSSGMCYFGTSQQLATQFSPTNTPGTDPCVSHVRISESTKWATLLMSGSTATTPTTPAPTGSIGISAALQSKLIVFFDFRQGYTNLANPLKYNAAPHGSLTQSSTGVSFPGGSTSDYIEIDTDGNKLVPNYLAHTKKFTFYANLHRQTSESHQSYHYFYDCNSPTSSRGEFFDTGEKLSITHIFPSSGGPSHACVRKISTTSMYSGSGLQYASAGAVFNGASLTTFYSKGVAVASEDFGGSCSGTPLCLRLGYTSNSNGALKGRYVCYAIANDTLSAAELSQLQTMCT